MANKIVINIAGQDDVSAKLATIRKEFDSLSSSSGWKSVLQGVGMGIGLAAFRALETGIQNVANAIPDMISKGLAFMDLVDELGDSTGASATETSRLIGTYQILGISTDNLATRMGQLSRVVYNNEKVVNSFGITTRDAGGALLNQVAIAESVRQSLSGMADGTEKAAAMVRLFGRAGLDMADYLQLTDAQVKLINDDLQKMGIILSDEASAGAEAAHRELNRFGVVIQGLANQITVAVLPALTAAVNGLANWVRDNGTIIANFAAQVANFVLGMLASITGATAGTVTFSAALGAAAGTAYKTSGRVAELRQQIATLEGKQKTGVASSGGLSNAHAKLTEQLQKEIETLKALDAAQEKAFTRQRQATADAFAMLLGTMDAEDRASEIAKRRLELTEAISEASAGPTGSEQAAAAWDLAEAYQAVADAQGAEVQDPEAVASAQFRLSQIMLRSTEEQTVAAERLMEAKQALADLEAGLVRDTARTQIENVAKMTDDIYAKYEDTDDKKKALADAEATRSRILANIAVARQNGDMEQVRLLTLELEAAKDVITRAHEEIRSAAEITAHQARLARIQAEKTGAVGASADTTAAMLADLKKQLAAELVAEEARINKAKAEEARNAIMRKIFGDTYGTPKGGLVDLLSGAAIAGQKFGEQLKVAFDGALTTAKDLATAIGDIRRGIQDITNLVNGNAWRDLTNTQLPPGWHFGAQPPPVVVPGGASGGWVGMGGPQLMMVGERGPEYLVPNNRLGAMSGLTLAPGAIVVNGSGDPEAVARSVMLALKRETQRQGMSF